MFNENNITLLTEGQVWGNAEQPQLEVLKKYGTKFEATDVVLITGGYISEDRKCWVWTQSSTTALNDEKVTIIIHPSGNKHWYYPFRRYGAIVPVIQASDILPSLKEKIITGPNGIKEVDLGEYIQVPANPEEAKILENSYNHANLKDTGETCTLDSRNTSDYNEPIKPVTYRKYEYKGKKYVRIKTNPNYLTELNTKLSNGENLKKGEYIWLKVLPVRWLVDEETGLLIAKKGLLSGVIFDNELNYNGDFYLTEMNKYLKTYMFKDLFSGILPVKSKQQVEEKTSKLKVRTLSKIKNNY